MSGLLLNANAEQFVFYWFDLSGSDQLNAMLRDGWRIVSVTQGGTQLGFMFVLERLSNETKQPLGVGSNARH